MSVRSAIFFPFSHRNTHTSDYFVGHWKDIAKFGKRSSMWNLMLYHVVASDLSCLVWLRSYKGFYEGECRAGQPFFIIFVSNAHDENNIFQITKRC